MTSRGSWFTALSASVILFVGRKLNAVGEIIAQELERSYAGTTGREASLGKKGWRVKAGLRRLSGRHWNGSQ